MRESDIQYDIIKFLESEDWLVVKIIQSNKNGWPDLQAHKAGITLFIEVKSEKGIVSELQKYRHKQLREQGFYVFIVKSKNQLKDEFNRLSENLRQQRIFSNLN